MNPPLFSTITLITELALTGIIFYVILKAYRHNLFSAHLAFIALAYETIFNISYMAYRSVEHEVVTPAHTHTPFHIGLAIFHGTFSLLMFVSLIVFFVIAWRRYKKGHNFFKAHTTLTSLFLFCWLLAVGSGALFYWVVYFGESA